MIPVNSGVILLNPNIITKSRKLTLISYYQRIHTSHSGSSKCPNMCFMQNTPVRDHVFYLAFRSFSFSMEYFLQSFLDFQGLGTFEYYRSVIVLYNAPNFIFSEFSHV